MPSLERGICQSVRPRTGTRVAGPIVVDTIVLIAYVAVPGEDCPVFRPTQCPSLFRVSAAHRLPRRRRLFASCLDRCSVATLRCVDIRHE